MTAFGESYAEYYDLMYSDKSYEQECDFLEQLWRKFSLVRPQTVLDLGCGTGGHATILAKRGYTVTGVDASPGMITIAKRKAQLQGLKIDFRIARLEAIDIVGCWDSAISMFNVIDYLTENDTLLQAFVKIRQRIVPGGVFIFDFRNDVTSIRDYSPLRIKDIRIGDLRLIRISETHPDLMRHLFYTTYTCLILKGGKLVEEFQDRHVIRFFSISEISYFLEKAGFTLVHLCPFMKPDEAPAEKDWNITAVARV